eukprot:7111320-Prymnesium_polylepis.1
MRGPAGCLVRVQLAPLPSRAIGTRCALSEHLPPRSSGLSTVGLKSELMERLENVMQHERLKFQSWDPETLAWV